MPVAINISDDDISFAEDVLLPAGATFDVERRAFIKNLSTIDLHAVPGSGKTTALLAKLLILSRKLPFSDGSGILVISHTNTAVDEIKDKIGKFCPGLFAYPNFCGTIQSFTDEFLARPYYTNKFKKRIIRIDNEIYEELTSKYSMTSLRDFAQQEQKNAKRYLRINDLHKNFRFSHNSTNGVVLTNKYNGPILDYIKPRGNTRQENYIDWTDEEKRRVKKWIYEFKMNILKKGFLCYDDAYFLAFQFLIKNAKIKTLLQKRFSYVFVDEMQDMDRHQYDLLEKIFWDGGNSISSYQRVGDKNQAIYNGEAKIETIWTSRDQMLELNGSHRLSSKIASVVQPMALSPIIINGEKRNSDGTDIEIKPHIIVYRDSTITAVIPKFAEIIEVLRMNNLIPEHAGNVYKAIAWNTKPEAGKIRLVNYHPTFSREESKPKIDFVSLESYLVIFDKMGLTLESIRKNILNSFLRILRIENILDSNQMYYSKSRLIHFMSNNLPLEYEKFKLKLYQWSIGIIKHERSVVLEDIKQYLPEFLQIFGKQITDSNNFINTSYIAASTDLEIESTSITSPNIVTIGNTTVEVGTVHSSKGQTHTGTLYLETFYKQGQGNYESERLAAQFKGTPFNVRSIDIVKQSAKMMYVGLSRPTHLVCIAVHKDRFDEKLGDIDRNIWEVIEV